MKKTLLFATGNKNKITEIRALLKGLPYEIITMGEIGFHEDIPETGSTLEENAILKAQFLYDRTKKDVMAEDTGLEVEVLGGAPGVHTARYAGEDRNAISNMSLLLENMQGAVNRRARFHTVIALMQEDTIKTFHGIVDGTITTELKGKGGFGYDPIFIPEGYNSTFAEMDMSLKSSMSHRGRALDQLLKYLRQ